MFAPSPCTLEKIYHDQAGTGDVSGIIGPVVQYFEGNVHGYIRNVFEVYEFKMFGKMNND